MIGCEGNIESNTTEIIDSNGNRVYKHQLSYNLSAYEDLDAASGKISLFSASIASLLSHFLKNDNNANVYILLLSAETNHSTIQHSTCMCGY